MTSAAQLARWESDGGHVDRPVEEARHAQADHVGRQMVAVADRLCREFAPDGGPAAESIRDQVRDARDAFGSPRVIAYLPTLVERSVRRGLRCSRDGVADSTTNDRPGISSRSPVVPREAKALRTPPASTGR